MQLAGNLPFYDAERSRPLPVNLYSYAATGTRYNQDRGIGTVILKIKDTVSELVIRKSRLIADKKRLRPEDSLVCYAHSAQARGLLASSPQAAY
jgi:hypothetical protein